MSHTQTISGTVDGVPFDLHAPGWLPVVLKTPLGLVKVSIVRSVHGSPMATAQRIDPGLKAEILLDSDTEGATPAQTADRQLRADVDLSAAELNAAIHRASEAGLLVSVGMVDRQELGPAHPVPVLHTRVVRPA